MKKQQAGRMTLKDCVMLLIFVAVVIHVVAILFGFPFVPEVFDGMR